MPRKSFSKIAMLALAKQCKWDELNSIITDSPQRSSEILDCHEAIARCCASGDECLIQALFRIGLDPAFSFHGYSIAHSAVLGKNRNNILKLLSSHNVPIDYCGRDGNTPLTFSGFTFSRMPGMAQIEELFQYSRGLVLAGANIAHANIFGETILDYSARVLHADTSLLSFLIEKHAQLKDCVDGGGFCLSLLAAGPTHLLQSVLAQRTASKLALQQALCSAAGNNQLENAKLLVEFGANPLLPFLDGRTMLDVVRGHASSNSEFVEWAERISPNGV